ncbi:hypothetical protein [Rhizobium sp. MHM7A]|uniref:hypothetical protein n=1 Tax=Rhizobium sp. MHM7A TaxID=2583233 RepID=UPI00110698C7|nr:hypothetical protein [Rhizobium sp. MHM7A]TLX15768.1 hypothetical protein FFR93_00170 [Rhizobium sp. MHM7A]
MKPRLSPAISSFSKGCRPTKDTAALAASLGFIDPCGVYASLTAYLMREANKHVDPMSDLAREIVAYAFQAHPSSFFINRSVV